MKKQYLAWPIGFELRFDKNRHSVRVCKCFQGKFTSLVNAVNAAIAETEEVAVQNMLQFAETYIRNLRLVHSTIREGDIDVCYMSKEIVDGAVLISNGMIKRKTI